MSVCILRGRSQLSDLPTEDALAKQMVDRLWFLTAERTYIIAANAMPE
jgi:hypothetical protein